MYKLPHKMEAPRRPAAANVRELISCFSKTHESMYEDTFVKAPARNIKVIHLFCVAS